MRENLTPAVLNDDIERLKEWLKKQPHLPQDVDIEILTSFVHGTKSVERAKQKLDAYFSMRSREPKMFEFSSRDPTDPDFRKASLAYKNFYLPGLTPEGYRVFYNCSDPQFDSYFVHTQEITRNLMLLELGMKTWPDTKGLWFAYDMKYVTASVMTKISPGFLASALQWFTNGYPVKLKGAIVFNASPLIEMLVQRLFKPFMKAKLYERIIVTSEDHECLKKYFPEEMIPCDYGGKLKSIDELYEYWDSIMINHREWFKRTSTQMSDETKRPPDSKCTFGVEGTFRSLGFD